MITLNNQIFQAQLIPEIGGQVVSLVHSASGTALLRTPPDEAELQKFPEQFGMPVLFPPNRIKDGTFIFEGKEYHLPITDIANHNHLHGLVVGKPWKIVKSDETSAVLSISFTEERPEFEGFPFPFTLTRTVNLTESGLTDTMVVRNDGRGNMPLGLGFHTTFPAVGAKVRLSTGDREIETGDRLLPTGRMIRWKEFDPREYFEPVGRFVGFHTKAETLRLEDGTLLHGAEVVYPSGRLRYHVDEKFAFWYTWNRRGLGDFVSLEPLSWMADALNQPGDASETGVRSLGASAEISFRNHLEFLPTSSRER